MERAKGLIDAWRADDDGNDACVRLSALVIRNEGVPRPAA